MQVSCTSRLAVVQVGCTSRLSVIQIGYQLYRLVLQGVSVDHHCEITYICR